MIEFTILYRYEDKDRKAGVMKSVTGRSAEYDIRPVDPSIVQRFGKQITIFKEEENYNTNVQLDEDHADFFNSLVNALKVQDTTEYSP